MPYGDGKNLYGAAPSVKPFYACVPPIEVPGVNSYTWEPPPAPRTSEDRLQTLEDSMTEALRILHALEEKFLQRERERA